MIIVLQLKEATEFLIDETFGVPGVGTVVAGTVKRGAITQGASLLLGPDLGDGSFKPTAIKSVHYKRLQVHKVCIDLLRVTFISQQNTLEEQFPGLALGGIYIANK